MSSSLFVTSLAMATVSRLVLAHEIDGLEPTPQKCAKRLRTFGDELVGGEDHMDMEVLDVGEADQDAAFPPLLELECVADIHDGAIDVAPLHRRDLSGHGAHGRDIDSFRTP